MALIQNSISLFYSTSQSVSINLALEETLMAGIREGEIIILLYENDEAVVIGRYQNPWRECRTGLVRRLDIPVIRRISGGGTVVHAPGNLNFAIIGFGREIDKKGNLDRIIEACSEFGLSVERTPRYDLMISGERGEPYKVSGSAFRQTAGGSLHHGTLLVDANLNLVRSLLKQAPREIETRGVISKASPITNLSSFAPHIDVPSLAGAIASRWDSQGSLEFIDPADFTGNPVFNEASERLASDEWNWAKTPVFRETFSELHTSVRLVLEIKDGRVSEASNAEFLKGVDYQSPAILSAGGSIPPVWLSELARRVDGDPANGSDDGLSLI